jgi:hypothetical protein
MPLCASEETMSCEVNGHVECYKIGHAYQRTVRIVSAGLRYEHDVRAWLELQVSAVCVL